MRKILIISSIVFGGFLFAQNSEAKITVKQVQKEFKFKKYSPEILKKFVNEIDEVEQVPNVFEEIPGEIISWSNDRATYSTSETFWIKNNKLTKIETQLDEKSVEKINKYAPKNKYFQLYDDFRVNGTVIKKLKNGMFLLGSMIKLVDKDGNNEEGFGVEYQTKDFKNFIPLKITKLNKTWKIIK